MNTNPFDNLLIHFNSSFSHSIQNFQTIQRYILMPSGRFPNFNQLYCQRLVDILGLGHGNKTFNAFVHEIRDFEGIEKVSIKLLWRFEVIEKTVKQYEGSNWIRSRFHSLIQKTLQFDPIFKLNHRQKYPNERSNTPLDCNRRLPNIPVQQKCPKLSFLILSQPHVKINNIPLEQNRTHLPMRDIGRVGHNGSQNFYTYRSHTLLMEDLCLV